MQRYSYEAEVKEAANLAVAHVLKTIGLENLDPHNTAEWNVKLLLKNRIGDEDLRITNLRYDIAFTIGEATYGLLKQIDADEDVESASFNRNRPDRLLASQLV